MPLSGLRRKSQPADIVRTEATGNASFPAGEASPVVTNGPEPVLTPYMQPRPRSSWYSQASVSYEAPFSPINPYAPPSVPTHLATSAPTPLNEAVLRAASEEWEDDDVPESLGGTPHSTPDPYLSWHRHTAVSEYLRERAWMPTTPPPAPSHASPMPNSIPPPVPRLGASVFRQFSHSSEKDRSLSRQDTRRGSAKSKRSSITTLPYPVSIAEHEHEQTLLAPKYAPPATPPQQQSTSTRTPSSKFLKPFSFSTTRSKAKTKKSSSSPAASFPLTDPFVATPYEESESGRPPIPVTILHAFDHQVPNASVANAALIRGLSQKYGPSHIRTAQHPSTSYRDDEIPNRFDSVAAANDRATTPPSYPTQPSSAAQNLLRPKGSGVTVLSTRTRNPAETSDEGSWLYIGTLRGPTPAGVRMVDELMAKSLDKKGTTEKGIKEIRKLFKQENRTTIEWTEAYLRRRWGAEL